MIYIFFLALVAAFLGCMKASADKSSKLAIISLFSYVGALVGILKIIK